MRKILALTLSLSIVYISCRQNKTEVKMENNEGEIQYFGEKISTEGAISFDQLLETLETVEEVSDVVVSGKVGGVCQVKGCWMNVVSENDENSEIFVKFKDYGFFMPLDLTGNVVMKGRAYKEETSVEELRHYAEDEGKSAEEIAAITEPVTELKFMAEGVVVPK